VSPPAIRIDLSLPLDRFVLRVEAALGRAAAILGPSGAGKTALLESIAGLRPARGRVEVAGAVLQDTEPRSRRWSAWSRRGSRLRLPPERRRLGYVPQEGALFPHLSVRSNLLFGRRSGRGGRVEPAGEDELAAVVAALDLEPLLDRSPRHLSGGERRRVALGRALLARPRLLLLDEPTAGLDPLRARKALARVRQVRRELGVPLLVVTHRPEEAAALAEEVVVLEEGRVRDAGAVREVLARLARGAAAAAETLVEARVEEHRGADGVTRVRLAEGGDGVSLSIPHLPDLAIGERVLLAVGADEVLVSVDRPAGLSARNAVRVVVEGVEEAEDALLLRAGPWMAHLTPEAVRELGLVVGREVWLVVKTHAWRVVAG
jgi:molybdate transport system ATP-binding protein